MALKCIFYCFQGHYFAHVHVYLLWSCHMIDPDPKIYIIFMNERDLQCEVISLMPIPQAV